MKSVCITILALLWVSFVHVDCNQKNVNLINNGYEGVVIAISPAVAEDDRLIDDIKRMMTVASESMFTATKMRAYFKKITILIPKTWTNGFYPYAVGGETFATSDIRIAPTKNEARGPYTFPFGRCGEHLEFIKVPPTYLKGESRLNRLGKIVVHEWGHYRWGLKDEYPIGKDANETHRNSYYHNPELEGTRCSASIRGTFVSKTGQKCDDFVPQIGCEFQPDKEQPEATASLMYVTGVSEVAMFCHDDMTDESGYHNKNGSSYQNRYCDERSAWEVLMESVDFQQGRANEPNSSVVDIIPSFTTVKHKSRRIVLVMDTSGSMRGEKIKSQKSAAELLITSCIADGTLIGLVKFDSEAVVLAQLTKLNHSDDSRKNLATVLPLAVGGRTGIGKGISEALEILKAFDQGAGGGEIIVLTDGDENVQPYVNDVAQQVLDQAVKVYSVFIELSNNNDAQALASLSDASGGRWFIAEANKVRAQLQNIFATLCCPDDGDPSTTAVLVDSFLGNVNTRMARLVNIESSVGVRTTFTISWFVSDEPNIEILPPDDGTSMSCRYSNKVRNGVTYCSEIHLSDPTTRTVRFTVPDLAKVGRWTVIIETEDNITLSVTSAPSKGIFPVILEVDTQTITSFNNEAALIVGKLFQNDIPVLGADVTANINSPNGDEISLQLFDNGAGADVLADDGVYSRYFTDFNAQGRYSVQVEAFKSADESPGIANLVRSLQDRTTAEGEEDEGVVSGVVLTGNLQRISSSPGFAYTGLVTNDDIYPPNKITDLSIAQVDMYNATAGIRITFTAPGDDFDSGTASRYDVRVTNESGSTLLSEFDQQLAVFTANVEDFLHPKPALEKEEFVVLMPAAWAEQKVVRVTFAVRAYDEVDNLSEVSNIASTAFFYEPPSTQPPSTQPSPSQPEESNTWIIVGVSMGGAFVLIALILLFVFLRRRVK